MKINDQHQQIIKLEKEQNIKDTSARQALNEEEIRYKNLEGEMKEQIDRMKEKIDQQHERISEFQKQQETVQETLKAAADTLKEAEKNFGELEENNRVL